MFRRLGQTISQLPSRRVGTPVEFSGRKPVFHLRPMVARNSFTAEAAAPEGETTDAEKAEPQAAEHVISPEEQYYIENYKWRSEPVYPPEEMEHSFASMWENSVPVHLSFFSERYYNWGSKMPNWETVLKVTPAPFDWRTRSPCNFEERIYIMDFDFKKEDIKYEELERFFNIYLETFKLQFLDDIIHNANIIGAIECNDHYFEAFQYQIHPRLKENIWRVHVSDPKYWTISKLAQLFKLKAEKVEAILTLKALQKQEKSTNPDAVLDDAVELVLGGMFGFVGEDGWDASTVSFMDKYDREDYYWDGRHYLKTYIQKRPSVATSSEHFDQDAAIAEYLGPRLMMQDRGLTVTESKVPPGVRVPNVEVGALTGKKRKNARIPTVVVDTSQNVSGSERMIYYYNADGTVRTATLEERKALLDRRPKHEIRSVPEHKKNIGPMLDPVWWDAVDQEQAQKYPSQRKVYQQKKAAIQKAIFDEFPEFEMKESDLDVPFYRNQMPRRPGKEKQGAEESTGDNENDTLEDILLGSKNSSKKAASLK